MGREVTCLFISVKFAVSTCRRGSGRHSGMVIAATFGYTSLARHGLDMTYVYFSSSATGVHAAARDASGYPLLSRPEYVAFCTSFLTPRTTLLTTATDDRTRRGPAHLVAHYDMR